MNLFKVWFDPDRTRVDIEEELMGWGIQFPDDTCYVYWNRQAYPKEDRLDHPHVSIYGSLEDVRQGTGGFVQVLDYVFKEARR